MPEYIIREVKAQEMRVVIDHAAWKAEREIVGQFKWCASGGEGGQTLCAALLDEVTNSYVGFVGLTLAVEDLQSDINVFVSVEFVYLWRQVRGLGLSKRFIEYTMKNVTEWLRPSAQVWDGKSVTLYSASNPKSDAGAHFVTRVEERLRAEANRRQWLFVSSIEDEG